MKRSAVVFDIDGTLSDVSHREHLVRPKCPQCNGKGCFEGKDPCGKVLDEMVKCLPCEGTGIRPLKSEDWDRFFEAMKDDKPNLGVVSVFDMVYESHKNAKIILVTGRPEKYLQVTNDWLWKCLHTEDQIDFSLFMREDDDRRPDSEYKAEVYRKYIEPKYNVLFWLEDRDSVVKMVREELGLPCFQVRDGNF